jgi:hypothetical protein
MSFSAIDFGTRAHFRGAHRDAVGAPGMPELMAALVQNRPPALRKQRHDGHLRLEALKELDEDRRCDLALKEWELPIPSALAPLFRQWRISSYRIES